ncbi:MAG TPA: metallophosphoesterase [Symbiobacteriaceae bacterium]|nr:metallophosphoesterase [Symbiobacteriaceae bacterium]
MLLTRRQLLIGAATVIASATGCTRLAPTAAEAPTTPGPEAPPEEGPRPLLRVALLSDPHTVAADSNLAGAINGKFSKALADYKPLRPDLWIVNGDVTDGGTTAEYAAFKKLLKGTVDEKHLLVNTGNHDFYDQSATDEEEVRRFLAAFGTPAPYSNRLAGGLHFVMLATEQWKSAPGSGDWAWLSAEQLRWFEQVLAEHRDRFTVVALHQALQDTVYWSHGGAGNRFTGCGQIAELNAIMKKNPQIRLWLSGHTHMGAEIKGNVVSKNGVTYVGLGSTFYQFVPGDGPDAVYSGFRKDLSSSQSRMLDVWEDKVVLRARDHVGKAWMDGLDVTLGR